MAADSNFAELRLGVQVGDGPPKTLSIMIPRSLSLRIAIMHAMEQSNKLLKKQLMEIFKGNGFK